MLFRSHGFLRIIPPDLCYRHVILNGHPGLINFYPELKGKDPQERVLQKPYEMIGSVVHYCTLEVDGGDIVDWCAVKNTCLSVEDVYNKLRETSLLSWKNYLEGKL